jgi:hypothetical protein
VTVVVDAASVDRVTWLVVASVSHRRVVNLIFAGWLPQDGLFGWSGSLV